MFRMARGMVHFRLLGFARGDGDNFHAHIAGDGDRQREPNALPAGGKKASMSGEIGQAQRMSGANTKNQAQANNNKGDNGRYFDHGEPVFEFTQPVHLHGIESHQGSRNQHYPNPLRYVREPVRNINAGGSDFSANGDDLRHSIRCPNRKAGPGIQILFSIDAKGPGHGWTTAISVNT